MTGSQSGTSGGETGTNGVIPLPLYGFIAAVVCVVVAVNVSSSLIEHPPTQRQFDVWEPWLWEGSSAVSTLLLVPALYLVWRRFRLTALGVSRFIAIHVAAAVAFSLVHVAMMVAIRLAGYGLVHQPYNVSHGNLVLELIYEGRKDGITYAVMCGVFWGYERLRTPAATRDALPDRIEVRSDGRTRYLTPSAIRLAEAAGNYVELHVEDARPLLLRGTLNAFEARLKPYGFVRVHRSRLVNRRHVASFESTSSGDLRIVLDDGREVSGSRRYRGKLTS